MSKMEAERPLSYSSPAIRERRQRILAETRKMVAKAGLSGFNMDELCKRAGVAKRTLYNAFQSKEQMIATAIHEYFDVYVDHIPFVSPVGSLQRNIERLIWVGRRNMEIRNYIRAIMAIYFSPEANADIWSAMQMMGVRFNMEWINGLKSKRQLQPWINAEQLAYDVVRVEYVMINDWSRGLIADEDYIPHLLRSYLTFVAGATRGVAHREVEDKLLQLQSGQLVEETIAAMSNPKSQSARDRKQTASSR